MSEGGKESWTGLCQVLSDEGTNKNLLGPSKDWIVAADLPDWRDSYPDIVKDTRKRPDIVVWSESDPRIILIELSVPYESRLNEHHQYKLRKYEDLAKRSSY